MIDRLLKSHAFNTAISIATVVFLAIGIYSQYIAIKRNKLEIEKLEANETKV
jgi:hypothetical protein